MSALRVRPGLATSGMACLLLACQAASLAAQEEGKTNEIGWEVAPTAGWCLQFLMEPQPAADNLVKNHRLVLAREATGLPPAITRLINEEPKYADWAPAEVCTYIAEAIWVDGRRFDRGDGGRPIAALYWGVAAASSESGASDLGRMSLRVLGTNSSGLRRAMEMKTVPIDQVQVEIHPVKESSDSQYLLKLEGATIIYIGQPRADSTKTPPPQARSAAYMGNNKTLWSVNLEFNPQAVAGMSGALRILGRRGLAKALDRSPIRLLSPMISGGRGKVTFTK